MNIKKAKTKKRGREKKRRKKMEREKRSVCVPMTLCKPDWSPYRVDKRSNKRTPLLAALLLVYKSLASNKKVAFRKPSAL